MEIIGERPWHKNWPKGVPKHIEYPEITLSQLLRDRVKSSSDKTQFIFYGRKISFGETDRNADRIASALQKMGAKAGTRIAIMLPNSPQFAFVYYAVNRIGGVIVPVNPLYTPSELKNILSDSQAEFIFVLDTLYEAVKSASKDSSIKHIISTNISDFMPPVKAFLGKLLRKVPSSDLPDRDRILKLKGLLKSEGKPSQISVDVRRDPAVFMYTGGTTGVPKAAILTNYNLVSN